jgi:NAD(P)-dependent dehydrogenase (short-subunit alcohol dehydrogenase family)
VTPTTIVTGGSAGIGLAIARELARHGHDLVLVARRPDGLGAAAAELAADGAQVEVAALDVRDADAVSALVARLPAVDGVVNNAAGNFACPAVDLSPNGFRAVVEISLFGCFNFSTAVARRLIAEGRPGAVLNIVATYAWTGAPGVAHSAAAKAGMIAFTKSVATEWAPHGIRVNALAPGFVPTDNAVAGLVPTEEAQARMRARIPLGRFADVDEIARPAAFLMSDQASYMTGSVVTADGGRQLGQALHGAAA